MSSIDQRINQIEKSDSISYMIDPKIYSNLPEKLKQEIRKIDPDSDRYQSIDRPCFFCKHKITKQDAAPPNEVFDSKLDGEEISAHGKCLEYVLQKYPEVPMTELEGKIIRVRVDQSVL